MNKIKIYAFLCVVMVSSGLNASSDGTQILYSINMPGNPFQQPYYQMMVKADNENSVYAFSAANPPQAYTFRAYTIETGLWDDSMYATSDYVSLYADKQNNLSLLYGLSPYTFRGYTEGAASKLYMQRPAQVQLPFNPHAQNAGTASPVSATLPDYSDVFLSQTSADIYQSLQCSSDNCTLQSVSTQMPSWYGYIPRINNITRGVSSLFYGKLVDLTQSVAQTTFSPYDEALPGWGCIIAMGVTKMSGTKTLPSHSQILKEGVFAQNSWLSSQSIAFGMSSFSFAPVISPGYAGDAVPYPKINDGGYNSVNPLQSVLATGDLAGNYSASNFPYSAAGIPVTTYDGVPVNNNNGMSYFQLFAQNMQWFSLPTPLQTPMASPFSVFKNITPGQGIFSDAIQLAAMQAPAATSKVPVFIGSLDATTAGSTGTTVGITGPVMMTGAAPVSGAAPTNFKVPQAFLSELSVGSFKVGCYLQVPLATQTSGTWSGGLVQSASEDPLQYYQGVTALENGLPLMPYLPVYVSDPGMFSDPNSPINKPGWNYCPLARFNAHKNDTLPVVQTCYDTAASPMTNFYVALNGTR